MTTKTDATSDEREMEIRNPDACFEELTHDDFLFILQLLDRERAEVKDLEIKLAAADKAHEIIWNELALERQAAKVLEDAVKDTVWNFENDFGRCGMDFLNEALKLAKQIREGLK
jgi:hypothetical protein